MNIDLVFVSWRHWCDGGTDWRLQSSLLLLADHGARAPEDRDGVVEGSTLCQWSRRSDSTSGVLFPSGKNPFTFRAESAPATTPIVEGLVRHDWTDEGWIAARGDLRDVPVSIYEVHLGNWRLDGDGAPLDYAAMGDHLIDYVPDMGFTHVEFLPLSEHPFSGSWGYQLVGLFAPTSRLGSPADFAALVDRLHGAGIGLASAWGANAPYPALEPPAVRTQETHGFAYICTC